LTNINLHSQFIDIFKIELVALFLPLASFHTLIKLTLPLSVGNFSVEGSEWEVLEAILDDYKGMELPFGQMQIEVHAIAKGAYLTVERMDRWWRVRFIIDFFFLSSLASQFFFL
jgi:hypothetical protein